MKPRGERIFYRPLLHTLQSVGGVLQRKYPSSGIGKILNKYFGEAPLQEALKDVLITSYDIERRKPYFFKRKKAARQAQHNFLMREVARTTTAAPTYFEPAKLAKRGLARYRALIDGSVFANNPALCALVEAQITFPRAEDILLVSVGTGLHTRKLHYQSAVTWGLAQWTRSILSVVLDGASHSVDHQLKALLPPSPDGAPRYYRLQTELRRGGDDPDDTSPKNIRHLKSLARGIIRNDNAHLKRLCKQLVKLSA